jgi:hypothetical protein
VLFKYFVKIQQNMQGHTKLKWYKICALDKT